MKVNISTDQGWYDPTAGALRIRVGSDQIDAGIPLFSNTWNGPEWSDPNCGQLWNEVASTRLLMQAQPRPHFANLCSA